MKRRDFLKKSISAGLTAGATFSFVTPAKTIFADTNTPKNKAPYDLVAIKNGMPDEMFKKGIAAMGGMERYVKAGQEVVVKPNIGWDTPPERGANTHPLLVKEIVKSCLEAGAKKVYVLDHSVNNWKRCYKNSGIEAAVESAGGTMVPANSKRYYKKVKLPKGKKLTSVKVHKHILNADVFINVPILKSHGSAQVTIGMKNLMGIVWDRGSWHSRGLHQCIADCASQIRPDLTVVDAYYVMKQNGPRGVSTDDVILKKSQLIAEDPVAVDAAATKLFGVEPRDIDYIKQAETMGIGTMNLSTLKIKKITV